MKVYLVWESFYWESPILQAIFISEKLAKKYVESKNNKDRFQIEDFDVIVEEVEDESI